MKLNACHYDTCLSDYFGGHHAPYLQIPIHKGMTLKAIKESLLSELNQGAIGGSLDWEEQQSERLYKAMKAAIKRMQPREKGQRKFFNDLEETADDECCEPIYAYFVFLDDDNRFYNIDWI